MIIWDQTIVRPEKQKLPSEIKFTSLGPAPSLLLDIVSSFNGWRNKNSPFLKLPLTAELGLLIQLSMLHEWIYYRVQNYSCKCLVGSKQTNENCFCKPWDFLSVCFHEKRSNQNFGFVFCENTLVDMLWFTETVFVFGPKWSLFNHNSLRLELDCHRDGFWLSK